MDTWGEMKKLTKLQLVDLLDSDPNFVVCEKLDDELPKPGVPSHSTFLFVPVKYSTPSETGTGFNFWSRFSKSATDWFDMEDIKEIWLNGSEVYVTVYTDVGMDPFEEYTYTFAFDSWKEVV